jgi:hypothetical protein
MIGFRGIILRWCCQFFLTKFRIKERRSVYLIQTLLPSAKERKSKASVDELSSTELSQ